MGLFNFDLASYLPQVNYLTGFWVISIFVVVAVLLLIIGGVIMFMLHQRKYKIKVEILNTVGSDKQLQVVGYDIARPIKLSGINFNIIYLKKNKCYRIHYNRKWGTNTYAYVVGENGLFWYNTVLGNFDDAAKRANIELTDVNIALVHRNVAEALKNEFQTSKFFEKYGVVIMHGIFILIMAVMVWFMFGRLLQITNRFGEIVSQMDVLVQKVTQLVEGVTRLEHANSGLR